MTEYSRIMPPPADLERECEILAKAFYDQFDDDDIIPTDAYGKYLMEHGSARLIKYLEEEQPGIEDETEE